MKAADQVIDELEIRIRRNDRRLTVINCILIAGGLAGVIVQAAMWPSASAGAGLGWPLTVIAVAVTGLVTGKRIRIQQEHIRWQREQIRMLTRSG